MGSFDFVKKFFASGPEKKQTNNNPESTLSKMSLMNVKCETGDVYTNNVQTKMQGISAVV